MNESLIQQYGKGKRRQKSRKTQRKEEKDRKEKEVLANLVPAAAVKRGGRVLFGMTGPKEYVGGMKKEKEGSKTRKKKKELE